MDLGLKGKTTLITGTGSQIGYGKAIAITLAEEGCRVISADIDLDGARKTADEIEAMGHEALAVKADVSNRAEVDDMVKAALERFGRIDVLVNNAGGSSQLKPFIEMNKADWDLDINVNLYGQMNVAQSVLPHMISQGYGRIINFTGGRGIPNISIYGAAKAGVIAFTEALAREVAPLGVIVNGIGPGHGETGLVKGEPAASLEASRQRSALKRLCTPDDVAPAVAFLASDRCSYMVGQFIYLSTF